MLDIITGSWKPDETEIANNMLPGLGATTMVISEGIDCCPNPTNPTASSNRQKYYKAFAELLDLDISGEKLDCNDMSDFSSTGSTNQDIYWDPDHSCELVNGQTAFSALVDGNYQKCLDSK